MPTKPNPDAQREQRTTKTRGADKKLTRAQAARLVGRRTADVLDARPYRDHVIVVTTDGQKLRGELQ